MESQADALSFRHDVANSCITGVMISKATNHRLGLLLIGHGSHDRQAQAGFLILARLVARQRPDWLVEPCFLSLAEPTIPQAVSRLYQQGIRRIVAMPALLLAAAHVKRDIPRAVTAACDHHADLEVRFTGHLGCHRHVLELSACRFREATQACATAPDEFDLLFVGRGSSDRLTRSELEQFVSQRTQITPVRNVEIGYLAICSPTADACHKRLTAAGSRAVVVQPHLLFQGRLFEQLSERISSFTKRTPNCDLILAQPLGPSELMARAIVDLAEPPGG